MRLRSGLFGIAFLAVVGVLLSPNVASAYVDPGTGSYILQMLMGGILGGLFAIKVFWNKISVAFRKKQPEKKAEGEPSAE